MINIDLLNPKTADTYAPGKTRSTTPAPAKDISSSLPRRKKVWPLIIGINALVLLVIIGTLMLLPADWLPPSVGEFVRQAQKAFTRLFNTII